MSQVSDVFFSGQGHSEGLKDLALSKHNLS